MEQEVDKFARFYAILSRRMGLARDYTLEDVKKVFVCLFTNGRTKSLREVTVEEYTMMCNILEERTDYFREKYKSELRHARSICLYLMQRIGVDTTDWNVVNKYCRSSKIAGREFYMLGIDDLVALSRKLRMILKKKQISEI